MRQRLMNEQDIYEKTSAGADEVRQRALGLQPRLRTMLIMVDGARSVGQLDAAATTLDAPRDFLPQLLARDLVRLRAGGSAPSRTEWPAAPPADMRPSSPPAPPAPPSPVPLVPATYAQQVPATYAQQVPATDADRFRTAQKFMNDCAVDALGLRAFFWTLKLEKAATCADLTQLLPDFRKAMAKARGEAAAALLDTRARSLLG